MHVQSPLTDRLFDLYHSRWDSPAALYQWAEAAGIEAELSDPAMLALSSLPDEALAPIAGELRRSYSTLKEVAAPGPEASSRLREQLSDRDLALAQREARRHLDEKAFESLGLSRSPRERWERAPVQDPALGPLLKRLRALRFEPRPRVAAGSARLLGWSFLEDPSRLRLDLDTPSSDPWRPRTNEQLTLRLQDEPSPWCTCRAFGCAHVPLGLDALLEAILEEGSALAGELRDVIAAPPWKSTLRRIDLALAKARLPTIDQDAEERLAWRIARAESGSLEVRAIRQKRLRGGGYSVGSQIGDNEAHRIEVRDPRERRALNLLYGPSFRWLPEHARAPIVKQALRELCGHPLLFLAGTPARPLELRATKLSIELEAGPDGSMGLVPAAGGRPIDPAVLTRQLRKASFDGLAVILDEERAKGHLLEVDPPVRELLLALGDEPQSFPAEAATALLERAARLSSLLPLGLPDELLGEELERQAELRVRVERIGPVALHLQILSAPAPGGGLYPPAEGAERAPGIFEGRRIFVQRDFSDELTHARSVQRQLSLEDEERFAWAIEGDDAIDLVGTLASLSGQEGVQVEWTTERWRITQAAAPSDLQLRVDRKRDWLGVDGTLKIDGEELRLAEALDAARRGARYVQVSSDTWVALGEELRERLAHVADQTYRSRGGLEVSLASIPALEALVEGGGALEAAQELHGLLQRIRDAAELEVEVPAGITAELRPYQVEGFRWLARLAAWGGGGCLADDMGLGKTLQALALLVHRKEGGPALVVAPTSVCGNWVREAERFAPGLRPIVFGDILEGEREAALAALGPGDLLIVSYTFLVRERERLTPLRFGTLILDESQAIKNPQTERAKAARALDAEVRIALSGTPLENHVGELWSLFQVVVPGLLGSWEQFRHRFAIPIEREGDPERRAALSRVLRPFLLRRTKAEVAAELPARTEIEDFIELSRAERDLYEQARLAAVARVRGLVGSMPAEKARFEVLAAITRLRLASCHPALYDSESKVPSSKLTRVIEILTQLKEEGHRALVFSQFTRHLALVREAVRAAGMRSLYLDGQTPGSQRQDLVDAFQRGEADHFLISLKAGGSGLNLTAADFVLHLDPWWNPAVEDQASDRAHRIGQTRPVTVVRLIARRTIEEQILALHAQKRELVSAILDGADRAAALDTGALIELIESSVAGGGDELEELEEADF